MISLTYGTNTKRDTVVVDANTPLAAIFAEHNVNVKGTALHLNGTLIPGVDVNKSLAQLGVADGGDAMIIAVQKADSAK